MTKKNRANRLLEKLKGKDLSQFGIRAEQTLKHFKEGSKVSKNDLDFIEGIINKHYT